MTDDAIHKLAALDLNDPNAAKIMAQICVPHASGETGSQEGVVPPYRQKYPKSDGKAHVSPDEAIRKYRERAAKGNPYPTEEPDAQIGDTSPDDLDPFRAEDGVGRQPSTASDKEAEEKPRKRRTKPQQPDLAAALVDAVRELASARTAERAAPVRQEEPNTAGRKDALSEFKGRKETVRMKLTTGQVTMPCLAVSQEAYGVTVFMDADAAGFVFVPEAGTEVMLSWGGRAPVKAYFPGAQFTVPGLGISGMTFLSDPDEKPLVPPEAPRRDLPRAMAPVTAPPPAREPSFKFNPETGLHEDEFGLTRD